MKKNYLKPAVKVNALMIHTIMDNLSIESGEHHGPAPVNDRSDLLDDWDL